MNAARLIKTMKQGWDIKTVGVICDIKTGRLDANAASENGAYPFFTCSQAPLRIDNYAYDCECVLVAGNGELNAKYYNGKFNAYQRTYIITTKSEYKNISVKYLYKFFSKYIEQLRQLSIGGVIKYIKLGNLTDATLPIPPREEQERIVEELDCLSGVIEKKREQLRELDALAESIFYTMFGDPITNEKGWEVKKLGDIATSQIGITYKPENVSDNEEGVVVLRSSNIQDSTLCFEDIVRVDCTIKENKYVRDGDILMCTRNGSFRLVGKVAMIANMPERMTYGAFMTIIRSDYQSYLFAFFKSPAFRSQLTTSQTATINQITVKMLDEIKVALPPITLQQEFADKIEAIEKQKELIKQSITETETLFNARMGYYFN